MAFLGGGRVIWSCLYLHLFSGKLFVLLSAEFLLHLDSGSVTDQLPKNAKLYGEILLNGFRQRLPYGTYVKAPGPFSFFLHMYHQHQESLFV